MPTVKLAFEPQAVRLPLDSILPLRVVSESVKKSKKYQRIEASLREVGLIEPLVVHPQKRTRGQPQRHILLDGHLRYEILRATKAEDVLCLVATDDEGFTYNHKVNQISPIQEHFMIRKALQSGLGEERLANALSLDVATIHKKRDLLEGICPEAVEVLRDHGIRPGAIRELRRVKPMRQLAMAELMAGMHNFSIAYAKCLIAATPQEQFADADGSKESTGLKPEDISRMERELQSLEGDFRSIEEAHGRTMLKLVLAVGYVRRILQNATVVRYLSRKHADLLAELERVVQSTQVSDDSADPPRSPPAADGQRQSAAP